MKVGRTIAVAVAMMAVSAGQPASADDEGGGCGSDPSKPATRWVATAACHFQFRGFPLLVRGSATATGVAGVRVWISAVKDGPAILAECRAAGDGSASCRGGFPDSGPMIDIEQLHSIWCNVEGRSEGQYWCQSALGI